MLPIACDVGSYPGDEEPEVEALMRVVIYKWKSSLEILGWIGWQNTCEYRQARFELLSVLWLAALRYVIQANAYIYRIIQRSREHFNFPYSAAICFQHIVLLKNCKHEYRKLLSL